MRLTTTNCGPLMALLAFKSAELTTVTQITVRLRARTTS